MKTLKKEEKHMSMGNKGWKTVVSTVLTVILVMVQCMVIIPSAAEAAGELILKQDKLGNIFMEGETVKIPVDSSGEQIVWTVTDFWGSEIASGQTPVSNGSAVIEPNMNQIGWFKMELKAVSGGTVIATKNTTFAIIRPTDVDPAKSQFGVMTHFAQGWNIDIMPLIEKAGIKNIRDELYWRNVEKELGVYDFSGQWDNYMTAAGQYGIEPLPVMSFGNPLYDWINLDQIWSVRRWISTVEGQVRITGSYKRGSSSGDGNNFKILIDGTVVFDRFSKNTTSYPYDETFDVEIGSIIEFAITPGPGSDINADYADFTAKIYSGTQLIADAQNEYSNVQGQNNWYYGYYRVPGGQEGPNSASEFKQMAKYDSADSRWKDPSYSYLNISKSGGHPSRAGSDPQFTAPYTDNGRLGYANYGKAILDHYGFQVKTLEVWNEYNGSFVTGPASENRPYYYTEMLKKAYEIIKPAYPNVKILGAASVLIPAAYFEDLFKLGALDYMDAIALHPYKQWGLRWNDIAWYDLQELNERIRYYNDGELKPIWATEFGSGGTDYEFVAKYDMRTAALLAGTVNVERMYLYLMRDYSNFNGYGLLKSDTAPEGRYAPNPSYAAYANMIHQLYNATPLGREIVSKLSNAYVFPFVRADGKEVRVAWTTELEPEDLLFDTNGPLTLVDIMGEERILQPQDGKVRVTLNDSIVYIIGDVNGITATAPQPIADSMISFSDIQGKDNWYYGYYDEAGQFQTQEAHYTAFTWNWQWQIGDDPLLKVTRPGGYMSRLSNSKQPVRRWVSDYDGTLLVKGIMGQNNAAQDNAFSIVVDGKEVFNEVVVKESKNYEVTINVKSGSTVDFVLKHSPGRLNTAADKTVFTARLYPTTPGSDNIPPITTVQLVGEQDNGVYTSDVTITLTATDNVSSVDKTEYSINGGTWETYTQPIVLTDDSLYEIKYRSIDKAGNIEETKVVTLAIDKVVPVFNLTVNETPFEDASVFEDYQPLSFAIEVEDNLSGVATSSIVVDGEPYQPAAQIDFAGKLGQHSIAVAVEDEAGNRAEASYTFEIMTSIDSMQKLLERYKASGKIKNPLLMQLSNDLKQAEFFMDKVGNRLRADNHDASKELRIRGKIKDLIEEIQDKVEQKLAETNLKMAIKHMENFKKHLNNNAMSRFILEDAKLALNVDTDALIRAWSEE